MHQQPVILFDGVCNLCNRFVQFVIRRDKKNIFHFAALQSEAGQMLLDDLHLPEKKLTSVVLLANERVYTRSLAALKIFKMLGGPVKLLYGFIIVPSFIRNAVYRYIANNRYKWFGKKESCMIPTPALQSKFLS